MRRKVFAKVLDEQRVGAAGERLLRRIERLELADVLEIRAKLARPLVHQVVHQAPGERVFAAAEVAGLHQLFRHVAAARVRAQQGVHPQIVDHARVGPLERPRRQFRRCACGRSAS